MKRTKKNEGNAVKRISWALALCVSLACLSGAARAEESWPERPITCIGPLAAGGGADITLRAIASYVKDHLGQPFLVVNKPGGGSTAAALELLSKPADGYTIAALLSTGYVPEVYRYFHEVSYTSKDLVPVAQVTTFPYGLYVPASSPWKTLKDLLADAKAHPGKYAYGHTGRGIQLHLFVASLFDAAGAKLREVPTKGAGEVLQLLLGKHIDTGVASITAGSKYVVAGNLRLLGVRADKRIPALPDVPTFKELGYDFGFPASALTLFVKAGTPPAIVDKLREAVRKTLEDPRYVEVARKANIVIDYAGPEKIEKDRQAEREVIAPILKKLGMYKE